MNIQPVVVYAGCAVNEGRKTIPLSLTLTANMPELIDLTVLRQTGFFSGVQTVFIDNSKAAGDVTITCNVSQFSMTVNPGTQGYYPIIMGAQDTALTVMSTTTGAVKLQLLNFTLASYSWTVQ